jgi:hypothetical protein
MLPAKLESAAITPDLDRCCAKKLRNRRRPRRRARPQLRPGAYRLSVPQGAGLRLPHRVDEGSWMSRSADKAPPQGDLRPPRSRRSARPARSAECEADPKTGEPHKKVKDLGEKSRLLRRARPDSGELQIAVRTNDQEGRNQKCEAGPLPVWTESAAHVPNRLRDDGDSHQLQPV